MISTSSCRTHRFAASVKVEYDDRHTGADLYVITVLNHAEIAPQLEHFHNCTIDGEVTADALTWAPDWSSEIPGETYIPAQITVATSRAHYTVMNKETTQPSGKSRPDIFRVHEVRCAEINFVTERLSPWLDRPDVIRRVRQWQPDDLEITYALTLNCCMTKDRELDWIHNSTATWVDEDFGHHTPFGNSPSNLHYSLSEATCPMLFNAVPIGFSSVPRKVISVLAHEALKLEISSRSSSAGLHLWLRVPAPVTPGTTALSVNVSYTEYRTATCFSAQYLTHGLEWQSGQKAIVVYCDSCTRRLRK
jgi:hypothetical protein